MRAYSARACLSLAALLALGCSAAGLPGEPPAFAFLDVVPLRVAEGVDPAGPLYAWVEVQDPDQLARGLRRDAIRQRLPDRLLLDLSEYPGSLDADPRAYRDASFVVDFDAPAVEELAASVAAGADSPPTLEALVAFTRDTIAARGERGFDVASQVARHRSGDCTEHAVLFAALARRFGWPTRIVVGSVFVRAAGSLYAYGHAWTEVYDADRWRPVDPTDIQGAVPVAYLPEGALRDEGPDYTMEMVDALAASPRRVEVIPAPHR